MLMKFSEKNLEDIIFDAPNFELRDRGLLIYGKKLRQVRIGNYGICDLISIDKEYYPHSTHLIITVYELKKEVVDANTLCQSLRYARGIKSYMKRRYPEQQYELNLVLIGSSLTDYDGFSYITQFFPDLQIYTYQYDFKGIVFTENAEWGLINEGFQAKNSF